MRRRAKISLLACLGAAALAGCGSGSDGTIPSAASETMIALLDSIDASVAAGDCELASKQADEFKRTVDLLPAPVDDEVKAGLFEAADNLISLTADPSQCVESTTGASGLLEPSPEAPTREPATTSTTTTPEPTTTTSTTTTQPADTQPGQQPPEQPSGGGGQGGGGSPSGGIGQKEATP
jgi:hypothetical protein